MRMSSQGRNCVHCHLRDGAVLLFCHAGDAGAVRGAKRQCGVMWLGWRACEGRVSPELAPLAMIGWRAGGCTSIQCSDGLRVTLDRSEVGSRHVLFQVCLCLGVTLSNRKTIMIVSACRSCHDTRKLEFGPTSFFRYTSGSRSCARSCSRCCPPDAQGIPPREESLHLPMSRHVPQRTGRISPAWTWQSPASMAPWTTSRRRP